jgi:hypothetical protein
MDHGTPDLFGYVPSSKPTKTKAKSAVNLPAVEPYFVVYSPGWKSISFLLGAVVAFISWYVFGAQLINIPTIDAKDLPSPFYGALIFVWLIVGALYVLSDFALANFSYFQASPDRRIFKRYRSRFKAWCFRTSISVGCVSLILGSFLLILHGYWNARSVAIVVSDKLRQTPKFSEDQIATPSAPPAAVARLESFGPPAPISPKLAPPVETGSIPLPHTKKRAKSPAVREVDPLSKSVKEICDWFERFFGLSSK